MRSWPRRRTEDGGQGTEDGGRRRGDRRRRTEDGKDAKFRCPKCGNDDRSMLETLHTHEGFCNICSHAWTLPIPTNIGHRTSDIGYRISDIGYRISDIGYRAQAPRFETLDQLIRRCGLRRDEVATLAEIGALNAFGFDRRTALWQIEQAVRPAGELFESDIRYPISDIRESGIQDSPASDSEHRPSDIGHLTSDIGHRTSDLGPRTSDLGRRQSPLRPMTVP